MAPKFPTKEQVQEILQQWETSGRMPMKTFAKHIGKPETTTRRYLTLFAEHYGFPPAKPEVAKHKKDKKVNRQRLEAAMSEARGNTTKAARILGMPLAKLLEDLEAAPIEGFYRDIAKAKTYVITSAQNATPVHTKFLAALKNYCAHHDAELIVIPIRYKNPTSIWSANEERTDWWDPNLVPYLCDTRQVLGPNLLLMADIKIQPTAVDPLTGFEGISQDKSCIFGHPKVALRTVPVPNHKTPKILTTTGSVTVGNYTPTKTGKQGEFHHSLAATVVELSGKQFHLRQIGSVEDGSFIDLDTEYTPSEVRPAPPAEALIMGDTHAQFVDKSVLQATLEGPGSIVDRIKPKYFVWHDVLDFYSANHHHKNQPFIHLAKHKAKLNLVENEVRLTFDLINKYMKANPESKHVFPESNHNAAFGRWIRECDWRDDPANAVFYLHTALYMASNTRMGTSGSETPNPFVYWGQQLLEDRDRATFLSPGQSFILKDIDVGHHGHLGPNGARGSLRNLARLGVKTIIGHSHSPGIFEGAYQVGTSSSMKLEYNAGPSSWLHTHAIIYANGKRTLVHVVNGEYTSRE